MTAQKANLPVVITAVIVLVTLLSWLGYKNFGPPAPLPKTPEAQAREDRWDALAKKSHGDYTKLTQEEQNQLMKETGGFGPKILQQMAKQHGY